LAQHHANEIVKFFGGLRNLILSAGAVVTFIYGGFKQAGKAFRKLKSWIDSHTQARQGRINPKTGEVILDPKLKKKWKFWK
jgi:hypothetical protein